MNKSAEISTKVEILYMDLSLFTNAIDPRSTKVEILYMDLSIIPVHSVRRSTKVEILYMDLSFDGIYHNVWIYKSRNSIYGFESGFG